MVILFYLFSSALSIFHVLHKWKGRVNFRKEKRLLSHNLTTFYFYEFYEYLMPLTEYFNATVHVTVRGQDSTSHIPFQ